MAVRFPGGAIVTLALDPAAESPLFRQLYVALRQSILAGVLTPGLQLPASRSLAEELGVSRNTVLNAYQQLLAEGYLEGKMGSGTYVPRTLPEEMMQVRHAAGRPRSAPPKRSGLSRRGELLAKTASTIARSSGIPRPFRPGIPALDAFPFAIWMRLMTRHYRRPPRAALSYDSAAGHVPLREAVAAHLGPARAVRCDPKQVHITTGSQQALDLIARLLLDPGNAAWIEEPGYPGARAALEGQGIRLTPIPVDQDGLDVAAGIARCPQARLVYVSPSHQYPLGVTLSLPRRFALLDWARRAGAWIVEDDYDSEFRYSGRPLAALQGLDCDDRVLYVGTFGKTLFPSLRLGYLVVPSHLTDVFAAARGAIDRQTATLPQAVVADFINEGHFTRHIRRMRTLYRERQETLLGQHSANWEGCLRYSPVPRACT